MFGELRHLRDAPRREADAGTGDENQRIALAVKLVVQVNVIDFDLAAFDRLEFVHDRLPNEREYISQIGNAMCRDAIEYPNCCQYDFGPSNPPIGTG